MAILDFNQLGKTEASAEDKGQLETSKNVEVKGLERKASTAVNGVSDDTNSISVSASVRPYHEKYATAEHISIAKESFQVGIEEVEESENDLDEDEEEDEPVNQSKDEAASPKVADFDFDVSSVRINLIRINLNYLSIK